MSSTHTKADYRKSTKYESSPEQIKKREMRNRARYQMEKKLGKKALKGKDVDHKDPLRKGGSNKASNWRVRSVKANRGDNR